MQVLLAKEQKNAKLEEEVAKLRKAEEESNTMGAKVRDLEEELSVVKTKLQHKEEEKTNLVTEKVSICPYVLYQLSSRLY